jgi:RNA polymerase sigma-70 factor (ECF subfamily)
MVYTIALRVTRNKEEAEEVAQDVFIKAFNVLSKFQKASKFSTWLYRIAYNESISRVRKKKMDTITLEEERFIDIPESNVRVEIGGLDEDEQKIVLGKVLARLNTEENLLISLYYLDGRSVEEVSVITGQSPSNVKVKLHRTRKKMYKYLHQIINTEINIYK